MANPGGTYATGHVPTAQDIGMAPQSVVNDGLYELLSRLIGADAVHEFIRNPRPKTALEAAAALPLPATKALEAGNLISKLSPAVLSVLKRAGLGFKLAGNAAAATNAVRNPNKDSALVALGLMLPTPEAGRLRTLAKVTKGAALANTAINTGTLGAAHNALRAGALSGEADAEAMGSLMDPSDRLEALHSASQLPLNILMQLVRGGS